jgi:hypothetical protein
MAFSYLEVHSMSDETTGRPADGNDHGNPVGPVPAGGETTTQDVGEPDGPEVGVADGCLVTREELLLVVKGWYELVLSIEHCIVLDDCFDKSLLYERSDAYRRIREIARVVGEDAVRRVLEDADMLEREQLGEEAWRLLRQGSYAELHAWHVAQVAGYAAAKAKVADEATRQAAWDYLRAHPTGVFFDQSGDLWHLAKLRTESGTEPPRLVLRVTTNKGHHAESEAHHVERPPGWFPPYGLE